MNMAEPRRRLREVIPGLHLGLFPTGPLNCLTDVPGVLVHTQSIVQPATSHHHEVNTGVTTILPRREIYQKACYAGTSVFNGAGELTGSHLINEMGLLASPIIITGTTSVGAAHDGAVRHFIRENKDANGMVPLCPLPVVAETWDGFLSDPTVFPVRAEHIIGGIENARAGSVKEGNTGGGTGMTCHGFKGGTGSASRKIIDPRSHKGKPEERFPEQHLTLGALVQANYGTMDSLRIGGLPVGKIFASEREQARKKPEQPSEKSSIIIILATDAPLLPHQLQRLAKRATVGLGRVGGNGNNFSGDIFLAFSTASEIYPFGIKDDMSRPKLPEMLMDEDLNGLFEAAGDVVEESIYNALSMAETVVGPLGRKVEALPLERVRRLVEPRLLLAL